MAIIAFFFLPNTPSSAGFLTGEEQQIAAHRLRADLHGATSAEQVEDERFNWAAVRPRIIDIVLFANKVMRCNPDQIRNP